MRNNTPVENLLILIAILALASGYGFYFRARSGRLKTTIKKGSATGTSGITAVEMGNEFGSVATLLQFSSAFCSPCRATRMLLEDVTEDMGDVVYVEIDAETNLELVRTLDIRSTPTTLFLDRTGHEVGRAMGAPKRDQVLSAISAIR